MAEKKWLGKVLKYLEKQKAFEDPEADSLLNEAWIIVSETLKINPYLVDKIELPTDFNIAVPEEHGGEFDVIELFGERFVKRKKTVDR